MESKFLEKRSKEQWEALWQKALKIGRCPFEGCDLSKTTCKHLDNYLEWGTSRKFFEPALKARTTDKIETYSEGLEVFSNTQGVWELFLKLRKLPLTRLQLRLLIRSHGLGMSRRQIKRELGLTSDREFHAQMKKASEVVKEYWNK